MRVTGRAYFEHGLPAAGLGLRFYHVGFGGRAVLAGEAQTGPGGEFTGEAQVHVSPVNLEIRAVRERDEVALTRVMYAAERSTEPLALVVPAAVRPLAGEYSRLSQDTTRHLGDARLGDAREDADVRDLTLLNRATRWDARLLAAAARADVLSERTGLDPQVLYGLIRAGVPDDTAQIARLSTEGAALALAKANETGVIALTEADIRAGLDRLAEYARTARRELIAGPSPSSYGDLLAATGLDERSQDRFDELFAEHTGDVRELWDKARAADLPVDRLRTTARLAYLTLNNAPLIADLLQVAAEPDALGPSLVGDGLYEPARWEERIRRLAGDQPLERFIPTAFGGDDAGTRLSAYAHDLARKVRLSYPTQVIAHRVSTGQFSVPHSDAVALVLDRAPEFGYSLGRTPLNRFLADHGDQVLEGLAPPDAAAALASVRTLHRLYQTTPTDEAMKVLLDNGFTSAQDITAMSHDTFAALYGAQFATTAHVDAIYRKAQQITTVVYSFLGAAKQTASAPAIPVVSPPADVMQEAHNDLIKQFPTIESLFGSLDFCECDHCRSVLSPAAYLVDLLMFLDPKPQLWSATLAKWKADHAGATYPYPDAAAWAADGSPAAITPYQALQQRRPDLGRLPLTCENTNTVLPYLDIVNEILETYVVEQSLDAMPVHDTGSAASADLLAEPANLLPAAYDILAAARYPLTLPFDLWRETLRGFCQHFTTPLWTLLYAVHPDETAAIARERLGLAPAEAALFTDPDPQATWRELYGYDPATVSEQAALDELSGAKVLARRLRVSYRELTAIVRGAYANPQLGVLATLRKLGVAVEDALRYLEAPGHPPFSPAEKSAFADLLGPDGAAWLAAVDPAAFGQVLVLADPTTDCGFDATRLQYADGTPADAAAFIRLNHFVRVWRRLGWPLEETDAALAAFGPDPSAALAGLATYATVAEELAVARKSRRRLLHLWTDLDDRTYAELFLTGSAQTRDGAFDDPLGRYLSDGSAMLADHLPTVQAALRLAYSDITAILGGLDGVPLSMGVISRLNRYAVLSGHLKMSVADLITLAELADLDPFADTEKFIGVAAAVKGSGVSLAKLDYLLRHRYDAVGPFRTAALPPFGVIRTLAAEIGRIRAAHAAPVDPLAFTDEVIRQELSQGLPAGAVETFLQMWTGTAEFTVVRATPPGDQLGPLDGVPELTAVYDEVRQEQRLTYRGILSDAKRAAMPSAGQPSYLDEMLDELQQQPRDFLDTELAGVFQPGDFAVLFADAAGQDADVARRALLAERYLPFLRDRLIEDAVIATVAADLAVEPAVVTPLIDLPAFVAVAEPFAGLDGYLEAPVSGLYRFFSTAADSELRFDHLDDPVFTAATGTGVVALQAGVPYGFTLTVAGGDPAELLVQADQLPKGPVDRLRAYRRGDVDALHSAYQRIFKTVTLAADLDVAPAELALFDLPVPATAAEATEPLAHQLFAEFLTMAEYAALREQLGAQPGDLLAALQAAARTFPASVAAGDAIAETLAGVTERLAKLTRRPPDIVGEALTLLGFAPAAGVGDPYAVTVEPLTSAAGIARVARILAIATRLGAGPAAVGRWATATPDLDTARDLRDTIKARHEPEAWRRVVRPIADALRRKRRDALVDHIMHTGAFDRMEQLYEFFLVDPGTEPVVQTSRLRLAISSVQLFVQRCLLNLERRVHPTAIAAAHWQWMKRYRVWEANRKIFLWPQTWLEPEFRDDKTHLFAELESALAQSDLTAEDAEDALFGYLRGLEELARLDIRSVYVQQRPDPADTAVHVLARTFQSPHRYFYRRYQNRMWTPWQPVDGEIGGDHAAIAVWRDRVHVLWAQLMEEAEPPQPDNTGDTVANASVGEVTGLAPTIRVKARLSWIELFQGQWSSPRVTDYLRPKPAGADLPEGYQVFVVEQSGSVDPAEVMVHATAESDGSVWLHLTGAYDMAFRLVSRNSPATPQYPAEPLTPPYPTAGSPGQGRYTGHGSLAVRYSEKITTKDGHPSTSCAKNHTILAEGTEYAIVTHARKLQGMPSDIGALVLPFFYADEHHTFFVEPRLTERTITESEGFVLRTPVVAAEYADPAYWHEVALAGHVPIGPEPIEQISSAAAHALHLVTDQATRAGAVFAFGDNVVGPAGGWFESVAGPAGLVQKGQQ